MLFPTFASGILLALLAVPGIFAIREYPSSLLNSLPAPTLIKTSFNGFIYTIAPELRAEVSQLAELEVHAREDNSDSSRPTARVRRTAAAFAPFNPTDVLTRPLAHISPGEHTLKNVQSFANGMLPRSSRINRQRVRAHAPRQSSEPCTNPKGTLHMTNAVSGALRGSLSRTANSYGEYGLGPQGTSPLEVVLRMCRGDAGDGLPFEIETLNGLKDLTYFGGIVGFASTNDTISNANANYVYIGGTTEVPLGPAQNAPNAYSAATGTQRDVESALWMVSVDNSLTMTWLNTDDTPAQGAHLMYVEHADALALTGNVMLFREQFGTAEEVVLKFVPNTGASV